MIETSLFTVFTVPIQVGVPELVYRLSPGRIYLVKNELLPETDVLPEVAISVPVPDRLDDAKSVDGL